MKPVEPRRRDDETARTVFIGTGQPNVEPLPAVMVRTPAGDVIRTEWELSIDERGAILDGARVVLSFMGRMPPCRIEVEMRSEVDEDEESVKGWR